MRDWSCPLVAAALALAPTSAAIAAAAEFRGTIVEFGRTEGDATRPGPDEGAGNGLAPARPMVGTRYVDHTDAVEARLCRAF